MLIFNNSKMHQQKPPNKPIKSANFTRHYHGKTVSRNCCCCAGSAFICVKYPNFFLARNPRCSLNQFQCYSSVSQTVYYSVCPSVFQSTFQSVRLDVFRSVLHSVRSSTFKPVSLRKFVSVLLYCRLVDQLSVFQSVSHAVFQYINIFEYIIYIKYNQRNKQITFLIL